MAAQAERGVDQDGAVGVAGGRQQRDDPVEQDGDVAGVVSALAPEAGRQQEQAGGEADGGGGGEGHQRDCVARPGAGPGGRRDAGAISPATGGAVV